MLHSFILVGNTLSALRLQSGQITIKTSYIAGNKSKHDELIALVKVKSVANDISESINIHGIHGMYIGYTQYTRDIHSV